MLAAQSSSHCMLYPSPVIDSNTVFVLDSWTHFLGKQQLLHEQCQTSFISNFCNSALVTDWYGENLPAVSSLYINTITLQLYSNQNPVSKILVHNCKLIKKISISILPTCFWTVVSPHDFKFYYSKNSWLCWPMDCCHQHIKYKAKLMFLSLMTAN